MSVAGIYDSTVQSPMGKQNGVFTVITADDGSFTGSIVDDMGTMEVLDGKVDGNALTWKMNMTVPVPMELTCEATIDGDALTGKVHAGAFGVMALEGTRRN